MWDGISYVDPTRSPVIHEGFTAAHIVVCNAGPSVVELRVWPDAMGKPPAAFTMHLPPGDTRSASGAMIALALAQDQSRALPGRSAPYAAVAWRVVR